MTKLHSTSQQKLCHMECKKSNHLLVPGTLKRTDCFWSQYSKSNLPNANACLLQSQTNFLLLLEIAPGESFVFSAFLLPTPVHSFDHYSSRILFQAVAHTIIIQWLLLRNAICNRNKPIYWWNSTKMKPINPLKRASPCDWVDSFLVKDST